MLQLLHMAKNNKGSIFHQNRYHIARQAFHPQCKKSEANYNDKKMEELIERIQDEGMSTLYKQMKVTKTTPYIDPENFLEYMQTLYNPKRGEVAEDNTEAETAENRGEMAENRAEMAENQAETAENRAETAENRSETVEDNTEDSTDDENRANDEMMGEILKEIVDRVVTETRILDDPITDEEVKEAKR